MDLTFTPAAKLAALYRSRTVSPLEVMRAVLERIDRVNPSVNAIVTLARESAGRPSGRASDRGQAPRRAAVLRAAAAFEAARPWADRVPAVVTSA